MLVQTLFLVWCSCSLGIFQFYENQTEYYPRSLIPSRQAKRLQRKPISQHLCTLCEVPFKQLCLPIALKLHKWCGIQGLEDVACVRGNGHYMNIVFFHFLEKGKVVNMTLEGVNYEQMGAVKTTNFCEVLDKANAVLMKLYFVIYPVEVAPSLIKCGMLSDQLACTCCPLCKTNGGHTRPTAFTKLWTVDVSPWSALTVLYRGSLTSPRYNSSFDTV